MTGPMLAGSKTHHCWPILSPTVMVVAFLGLLQDSQEGEEKRNWAATGNERSENKRENSSADPKVSEGRAGLSGAEEEIPLQAMVNIVVGQMCSCSPWRVMEKSLYRPCRIPHLSMDPWRTLWPHVKPILEQVPGRTCGPGEKFWPNEGHMLEPCVPEGMQPMGGIHTGDLMKNCSLWKDSCWGILCRIFSCGRGRVSGVIPLQKKEQQRWCMRNWPKPHSCTTVLLAEEDSGVRLSLGSRK